MTTETANALRVAKAMVGTPQNWRVVLEDRIDVFQYATNDSAVRNAMRGALNAAKRSESDEYTHADIMALFDRAIAAEEETV